MGPKPKVDASFDFRDDTPAGADPDRYSPTLRRYHKLLWSKPLPDGARFDLTDIQGGYFHHESDLGEFFLSSDTVVNTYRHWSRPENLVSLIGQISDEDLDTFQRMSYTIGGMLLFPCNQIDGQWTINQARGMLTTAIADRMDLTLECIRRHYAGEVSPLSDVLLRYREFFVLFGDFRGYVDFFLLRDLTNASNSAANHFLPCQDFTRPALPQTVEEYTKYRLRSIEFVEARNRRTLRCTGDGPLRPRPALSFRYPVPLRHTAAGQAALNLVSKCQARASRFGRWLGSFGAWMT